MSIFQEETMVDISLKRYEALIKLETRVNVAVELMKKDRYINNEDILIILGTPEALSMAENLMKKKSESIFKTPDENGNILYDTQETQTIV